MGLSTPAGTRCYNISCICLLDDDTLFLVTCRTPYLRGGAGENSTFVSGLPTAKGALHREPTHAKSPCTHAALACPPVRAPTHIASHNAPVTLHTAPCLRTPAP